MDSTQAPFLIHASFDLLAWLVAITTTVILRRMRVFENPVESQTRFAYIAAVMIGAGIGAWAFGSLNAWISGEPGLARSIEGALAGAILSIELFKRFHGITIRTGAVYALPVALGIAVGRIGCLLSGLDDFTYGTPTGQSWGWDFGDNILRHPVQLYESIIMGSFALVYVMIIRRGSIFWATNGFYLVIGFYALQRFALEFLKPYQDIIIGMTLFQFLSITLVCYAVYMVQTGKHSIS